MLRQEQKRIPIKKSLIAAQLKKVRELLKTKKTDGEEPMAMVISWMSRINKVEAQNSKPNQRTEPETEVKLKDDTPTTNP